MPKGADITKEIIRDYLPGLMKRYPGLGWEVGGEEGVEEGRQR